MIDLAAVTGRIRGMILQPDATLASHVNPVPPWGVVAREHVLPLLLGSALVSAGLFMILRPALVAEVDGQAAPTLPAFLVVMAVRIMVNFVILAALAALVATFAGIFGGRNDFNAGYALVALSMTPLYLGEAVAPLPYFGLAALFAGFVFSMVILYRGTVVALGVPPGSQGRHFALTLLSMLLVSMLAGLALGPYLLPEPG